MDAGGGVGLIKGRKFCHRKVTRPRFKAGSIKFAGNKTWAFDRFNFAISSRSPSGQSSESAASGAEMSAGSIGAGGADRSNLCDGFRRAVIIILWRGDPHGGRSDARRGRRRWRLNGSGGSNRCEFAMAG